METKAELLAMGFEPQPLLRAIREKCLDCSGGMASEVRDCLVQTCALYPFRMASNPWRAPVSEEHREAARMRFAAKNRLRGKGSDATDEPDGEWSQGKGPGITPALLG